jgi:hypothetical protein
LVVTRWALEDDGYRWQSEVGNSKITARRWLLQDGGQKMVATIWPPVVDNSKSAARSLFFYKTVAKKF